MPSISIRLTEEMHSWVESQVRPFHQKSDVVRDLILFAMGKLDTPATLAERPNGSEASSSMFINLEEELLSNKNKHTVGNSLTKTPKAPKQRKRQSYSEAFEAFWKLYQSAPARVSSQTKPKAFDEWRAITKEEPPERLLEAARRAVEQVKQAKMQDEWCSPLPDAFRWLRDERFAVLLEGHVPAGPQVIGGYVVYE